MFSHIKQARPLLMGLAIIGIAVYHAPFVLHGPWIRLLHDTLYSGVDIFLFLSGIGACHSISRRGGRDYLRQRGLRLLPGLIPFLWVWCFVMAGLGFMDLWSFLGSVTLLGWWLGNPLQLNWYFSAVWAFFLLAIPFYALLRRARFPALAWLGLTAAAVILGLLCPLDYLMTAVTRLPVFLTGLLLGVLEQRSFRRLWLLRLIFLLALPVGLWLIGYTFWGQGYSHGYSRGLWWYPFALTVPALTMLISDLAALLRRLKPFALLEKAIGILGDSSAEILMIHVGLYKILNGLGRYRNRVWVVILVLCLAAGCLYRRYVSVPLTEKIKKLSQRY